MRLRAAVTATRIAESFRESGQDVVLMMDSLTRVAMAQREIGLSAGEPPATRGYPPSTFSVLARLLERAGTAETGSITGIYTVLVDGDDHNEPIADAARSILDGHVVLDRKLAVTGHFPSVDVLGSVSRVASKVTDPVHTACAVQLRRVLAARRAAQDLIDVGAYRRGSNPLVDAALDNEAAINQFLRQGMGEPPLWPNRGPGFPDCPPALTWKEPREPTVLPRRIAEAATGRAKNRRNGAGFSQCPFLLRPCPTRRGPRRPRGVGRNRRRFRYLAGHRGCPGILAEHARRA